MFNRSRLLWAGVAIIVAAFVLLPDLAGELLAFLFIGILPYSTLTVPVWIMFIIDLSLLWLGVRWLRNQLTLLASSRKRDLQKRQLARAEVYRLTRKLDRKRARAAYARARIDQKAVQATATEPSKA
jgi:hypothetical protein